MGYENNSIKYNDIKVGGIYKKIVLNYYICQFGCLLIKNSFTIDNIRDMSNMEIEYEVKQIIDHAGVENATDEDNISCDIDKRIIIVDRV